ncbi:hypothetical protein FSP39_007301 [Pinctada imbricata]|uniref:Actin-related protein 10 n=1 Tax=Pinctada imbricata TaxID=66713 RepID=A0AA88XYU5_PINIB|nr:hypothetical protein FSP39_007301 [Pinctada imbricata]
MNQNVKVTLKIVQSAKLYRSVWQNLAVWRQFKVMGRLNMIASTPCGLAGETGPRCIIPSAVKNKTSGEEVKLWKFKTTTELYENLVDFLYVLYFRHLLVNPKDRRVVVCESMLCPSQFRETLALVLFKQYEVPSVLFAPSARLALLTLGINVGLVIDLGYTETEVVPVYENIPVIKALQSLPLGSKAIHNLELPVQCSCYLGLRLYSMLCLPIKLQFQVFSSLISVRCCFVTTIARAKKIHNVTIQGADKSELPAPPPGVDYPLSDGRILKVTGHVREQSFEVLFEQDNEEISITTMILDAIAKCPIDMRKELAENIVIIGGTAMTKGFHHRLCVELYHYLKQPKYQQQLAIKLFKFHKLPGKENYIGWLGGALIGALETLASKSVTKEAFMATRKLPDWCSLGEEGLESGDKSSPIGRTI